MDFINQILQGESLELLQGLPEQIADLTICSPPYFQQRQYSTDAREIGQEAAVTDYLTKILNIFEQCVRVTKTTGSIIFNVGDKYINQDLALIPFQFAIAAKKFTKLINIITWVKTNPTPRQFSKRLVQATEPFFHFVKQSDYKYFPETLSKPDDLAPNHHSKVGQGYFKQIDQSALTEEQKTLAKTELLQVIDEVKTGKLASFRMKLKGLHALPFGGQEGGRKTQIEKKGFTIIRIPGGKLLPDWIMSPVETIRGIQHSAVYPQTIVEKFIHLTTRPNDLVFDPFVGSGTSVLAAKKLQRRYLGFDLNPDYVQLTKERLSLTGNHLETGI